MSIPLPKRPNVRNCTHIKVTGQRCGSPALRGEFFCYFHTRVIKGVQQRVDMRLHSMALLEDCESIQLSIMHVVDGLIKGTLDSVRARLIIQALRIAARNAKNVRFEARYEDQKQTMVREVPDYARQYLTEHPEYGPPISSQEPARAEQDADQCGADTPVREAEPITADPCRRTSRKAAKERSPRRKPWDRTKTKSSSEGAKEPARRSRQTRTRPERIRTDHASRSRYPRRYGRQLARPPHRLRIRRHHGTDKGSCARMQRSFVGRPLPCQRLRCLWMTSYRRGLLLEEILEGCSGVHGFR